MRLSSQDLDTLGPNKLPAFGCWFFFADFLFAFFFCFLCGSGKYFYRQQRYAKAINRASLAGTFQLCRAGFCFGWAWVWVWTVGLLGLVSCWYAHLESHVFSPEVVKSLGFWRGRSDCIDCHSHADEQSRRTGDRRQSQSLTSEFGSSS